MLMPTWVSLLRLQTIERANSVGRHQIRYAILPHEGPLDSRTIRTAYNFNHPMKLITGPEDKRAVFESITLDGSPSLILDCIKRGEDDEAESFPREKDAASFCASTTALGVLAEEPSGRSWTCRRCGRLMFWRTMRSSCL